MRTTAQRRHHFVPRPRVAPPEIRKSDLPPAWRELLDVCFRLWFGSVHDLQVRNGQPAFAPTTVAVRTVKLTWEDDPCPPPQGEDYAVRREVLDLVGYARRLGDGTIERLDVVAGLPRSFQIRGSVGEVLRV
jgi:hypothetical protein